MKSLKLLSDLVDDICCQLPECAASLRRDLLTVEHRVEYEGNSFLTVTLPLYGDLIFRSLEMNKFQPCASFSKKSRKGALPAFLHGLLELVFDAGTGEVLAEASVEALCELRQICYLFKKVQLKTSQDERLDRLARRKFFEVEDDINLDAVHPLLIAVARVAWKPMTERDVRSLVPRNGPGAVFEGLRPNEKFVHLVANLRDDVCADFNWSLVELAQHEMAAGMAPKPGSNVDFLNGPSVARLISVPKNSTSRRTITVEPCCLMFQQQALNEYIRGRISTSPMLSQAITLDNQQPSKDMAIASSKSREFATLDLSAASDRLALRLVEAVFDHDRYLLAHLQRARSSWVTSATRSQRLRKYAGMGNATTFPIQSIIFTLLSVCAILEKRGFNASRKNVARALGQIRVFGDDLIVPNDVYHTLVKWLEMHGLKVNEGKSFTLSSFRESCGSDAYKGVEITPTYVRTSPENPSSVNEVVSLVATCNQLWLRGYYRASNNLRHVAESFLKKSLKLLGVGSGGVGLRDRYGSMTVERWNKELHRFEVKSLRIRERKQKDSIDGYPALLKSLLAFPLSSGTLEESVMRGKMRIREGWLAI